ncbi:MAG: carboxypeptidase regulatory-like domain-containing protein [Myxococcales bacterium]
MLPCTLLLALTTAATVPKPPPAPKAPPAPVWLADELPLPLAVRTPEDLQFKGVAERQYLVFNLLAGGKVAWDAGDWATAASKWEALLRLPDLPAEVLAAAKPFAAEARKRAGNTAPAEPPAIALVGPAKVAEPEPAPPPHSAPALRAPAAGALSGVVTGGGSLGPGGAVIVLRRVGGTTPRPKPAKGKVVVQKGKTFVPRVLAVPVGTAVEFRNEDEISHNVFSLSKPSEFDLGLYKGGNSRAQQFDNPGAVQLLCNIHSSMIGYVYAVDSPWFAQADATGAFTIKGVPAGEYVLEAWHEAAAATTRLSVKVDGDTKVSVTVGGDKAQSGFVPDKYGKPRQVQLGY